MKNKFVFRLLSGSLAAGALLCTLLMPGSRDESARVITAGAVVLFAAYYDAIAEDYVPIFLIAMALTFVRPSAFSICASMPMPPTG